MLLVCPKNTYYRGTDITYIICSHTPVTNKMNMLTTTHHQSQQLNQRLNKPHTDIFENAEK